MLAWSDGTPLPRQPGTRNQKVHVIDLPKHVEERRSNFEEVANSKQIPPGWLTLSAANEDTIPNTGESTEQPRLSERRSFIKLQPGPFKQMVIVLWFPLSCTMWSKHPSAAKRSHVRFVEYSSSKMKPWSGTGRTFSKDSRISYSSSCCTCTAPCSGMQRSEDL